MVWINDYILSTFMYMYGHIQMLHMHIGVPFFHIIFIIIHVYCHSAEQRKIPICMKGEPEIQQISKSDQLLITFATFTTLMCVSSSN